MKIGTVTRVMESTGQNTLSARAFYFLSGLVLIYGLGATALIANKMAALHFVPGIGEFLLLGLVLPFAGIFMASFGGPIMAFIGYNMVVAPFGIILAPTLNAYAPNIIEHAFLLTCGVTTVMMIAGVVFPGFFKSLGGGLFIALIGLVVMMFLCAIIPPLREMAMGWMSWAGACIFSLYIGYDMYRASTISRTMESAVVIALGLYLDILNLFMFLLRIVKGE